MQVRCVCAVFRRRTVIGHRQSQPQLVVTGERDFLRSFSRKESLWLFRTLMCRVSRGRMSDVAGLTCTGLKARSTTQPSPSSVISYRHDDTPSRFQRGSLQTSQRTSSIAYDTLQPFLTHANSLPCPASIAQPDATGIFLDLSQTELLADLLGGALEYRRDHGQSQVPATAQFLKLSSDSVGFVFVNQ
jgi:hypothetical protein